MVEALAIHTFCVGPLATNAFLVGSPSSLRGVIIDPAAGSYPLLMALIKREGWRVEKIVLTHSHWDHFVDGAQVAQALHVGLWLHPLDAANVQEPGSDTLPLLYPIHRVQPEGFLEEGALIPVGQHTLRVLHTPGHSPGGLSFYEEQEGVLFSGDTLFKGGFGTLSLPTASPSEMWHSLRRLATLPPETIVYPGHGERTTIAAERWLEEIDPLRP